MTDNVPSAIDLEIYEPANDHPNWAPIRPTHIRINGVECLTPTDHSTVIHPTLDKSCLLATITVFVKSLKVYEGEPSKPTAYSQGWPI